jgi:hypothetical protein
MIDGPAQDGGFAARTAGSAWEVDGAVRIEEDGAPNPGAGSLARVRVTGSTPYDLFARFDSESEALIPISGGRN